MPYPAADQPRVLAIDVGTSSCRALLYRADGSLVRGAHSQVRYQPVVSLDGGAELDPLALLESVQRAIDPVAARAGRAPMLAVGSDTFWHSLLGVDDTGLPVTPIYLWMDARSHEDAASLRTKLDEPAVHARTGCYLHWSYWPAKLAWVRRTRPDLYGRVRRWVSFGELFTFRLFGVWGVSISMASATGLLDQHTCSWDAELLEALELSPSCLSPLRDLADPFRGLAAPYADRWPSLRDLPWMPPVGDGATSNLGADCSSPDRAAVNIGTSGAERIVWRTPSVAIPPGVWCYRVDRARVILGGALNDGGSLFAWLRETLHLPDIVAEEQALAAMPPDAHGLTVLPFWAGERSPGWAPRAAGAVVGLRLATSALDLLRAALESVALQFGEIDALLAAAAPASTDVVATGRALLSSPTWMQILADVLGRPVLASAEQEASSRGAALLALEALGHIPEGLERREPRILAAFQPDPSRRDAYRAAARRQRRLYDLLVRGGPVDG